MGMNIKSVDNIKYYPVTSDNPIIMKLQKSKQKSLYHYTTKEGFKGIVNSKELWVTHSDFLEDRKEVRYIHCVLDGVIKYLKKERKMYNPEIKECYIVYKGIIKTLEALKDIYINFGAPISGAKLFILSLTECRNNKYLIENYCNKDGGILEFKNDISSMINNRENSICSFVAKVIYDYGDQMTLLLEDINDFWCELSNVLINTEKIDCLEVIETIKSIIYTKILNYSFFFKDRKYEEEKEYRAMFLVNDEYENNIIKYREKDNKKIPYIEVKFDDEMLIGAVNFE